MQVTQRSGVLELKIADIIKDEKILKTARSLAAATLNEDPQLQLEKNIPILNELKVLRRDKPNWSLIS